MNIKSCFIFVEVTNWSDGTMRFILLESLEEIFSENKIEVLGSAPDLNPIERLWGDVRKGVFKDKMGNLEQLRASVRSA